MTLAQMCRLCAESVGRCISVFGEDGQKNNLEHKLRTCSPVTVKQSDNFPTQICLSCLSALDQTYEFHIKIKRAQLLLKAVDEDERRKRRLSDPEEKTNKKIKIQFGSTTLTNLTKSFEALKTKAVIPTSVAGTRSENAKSRVPEESQTSVASETYSESPKKANLVEAHLEIDTPGEERQVNLPAEEPAPLSTLPTLAGPAVTARSMPKLKAEPKSPVKKSSSVSPLLSKQTDSSSYKSCKFCNRSFPLDIFFQHESLHKGATVFICDQCNKSFFNELAYKRHVDRHKLKKDVPQ